MVITLEDLRKIETIATNNKQPRIREKVAQIIEVLEKYKESKYITKSLKKDLEDLGFRYVEICMRNNETYKMAISTKEMVIDFALNSPSPTTLRIGVSCKSRYNAGWYEFDFNALRE